LKRKTIAPSVEGRLNKRQKQIIAHVLSAGYVTSGWCRKRFNVVYDTAQRDLLGLVDLNILKQTGRGRTTKYVEEMKKNLPIIYRSFGANLPINYSGIIRQTKERQSNALSACTKSRVFLPA
jgi:hypothetical protein